MYSELQLNPGWTDLDIFKITYDEYMAFSRQYMAGQVTSNLLSMAHNLKASSTDLVALFTKLIVESKEKVAPKGIIDKDIGGDDAITAKGIKEIPSISSRLLAIPTTVLPSEGDTNGVLNIAYWRRCSREFGICRKFPSSQSDKSTVINDVCCRSPTVVIPS
jgi:hypothetical protein